MCVYGDWTHVTWESKWPSSRIVLAVHTNQNDLMVKGDELRNVKAERRKLQSSWFPIIQYSKKLWSTIVSLWQNIYDPTNILDYKKKIWHNIKNGKLRRSSKKKNERIYRMNRILERNNQKRTLQTYALFWVYWGFRTWYCWRKADIQFDAAISVSDRPYVNKERGVIATCQTKQGLITLELAERNTSKGVGMGERARCNKILILTLEHDVNFIG